LICIQEVGGPNPPGSTLNSSVIGNGLGLNYNKNFNNFVNLGLALAQTQGNEQITELLVNFAGLQLGTPCSTQAWIDDFLASRAQGTSIHTMEFYQLILNQTVGIELTPKGINNWLTSLTCGNGKLNYYRAIKVYCNWLHKSKKIKNNPITLVDKPKIAKRILSAVTKEDLVILIKSVNCFRDACILRLLFDSGIRLGEIIRIKATDFDFDKGTVTVIGKGNKQRRSMYTKDTGEMLKQWFGEHNTFEFSKDGLQGMLRKLELKTGITCNAHCFRRGFAINQIKQGRPTRIVQSMGGWESISMVENYTKQLTQEDALKQYDRG
jgi:site-specific recombinase XerD